MKTNTQNKEIDLVIDEILEDFGNAPARTNSDWIKTLESRLTMQRKELAAMLEDAAENPWLLPECIQLRRKMQETKACLSDYKFLQENRN